MRREIQVQKTDAFICGMWYTVSREIMTYDSTGRRIRTENLAGETTAEAWDCCHRVLKTRPDGSTTTWDYDDDGRLMSSSRLIPLDMTNVASARTAYAYDAYGNRTSRKVRTSAGETVEERRSYDKYGRLVEISSFGTSVKYYYDIKGRVSRQLVDGSPIDYVYTKHGLLAGKYLGGRAKPDARIFLGYTYEPTAHTRLKPNHITEQVSLVRE